MKGTRGRFLALVATGLATMATRGESGASVAIEGATAVPSRSSPLRGDAPWPHLPLLFIENRGQLDPRVAFCAPGKGRSAFYTADAVTYSLSDGERRWTVRQEFLGARPGVRPLAGDRRKTVFSWFTGPRERWTSGARSFGTITYPDLWPGIDMVCAAEDDRIKTKFLVKPGADPGRIRFAWRGATSVRLSGSGALRVETPAGTLEDEAPFAFQPDGGRRTEVAAAYELGSGARADGTRACGFRLGAYDPSLPLVVDPTVIVYAGYIGGDRDDRAQGIAVDAAGCAYITGSAGSYKLTFPLTVGPDLALSAGGVFVAKVEADGTGLLYCGYLGGNGNSGGEAIAVNAAGEAYVTGITYSSTDLSTGPFRDAFPTATGPDFTPNGRSDAFVAKVSADGTTLVYCGYLGGSGYDHGYGIAVDGSGHAYVTGYTDSPSASFPAASGPDATYNGSGDAFVARVAADGASLDWCGYLGGDSYDEGRAVAVDAGGSAHVTGFTASTEETFPVAAGPDLTANGGTDAFVARVSADGASLLACGFLGGDSHDEGRAIALDSLGSPWVVGFTASTEATFPVAVGPDLTANGGRDAFVARVSADGTSLACCGFLGGVEDDLGHGIAIDAEGIARIAGATNSGSDTFPVTVDSAVDITANGWTDAFLAKVSADGSELVECGFLGGEGNDSAFGVAIGPTGDTYLAGRTAHGPSAYPTFPVTAGPDLVLNYEEEAFVARIGEGAAPPGSPPAPSGLVATAVGADHIDLAWTDNAGDETGFQVQRRVGTGDFAPLESLPAGSESYSDTEIDPLRHYTYRVRAINEFGVSAFSASAEATTSPSMEITSVEGTLLDRPYWARDRIVVQGTMTIPGLEDPSSWSPEVTGLEVSVGSPQNPRTFVVPTDPDRHWDGVWRRRGGRYAWRSGSTYPPLKVTIDLDRGTFRIRAPWTDFPRAPGPEVRVAIRFGGIAGSREDTWTKDARKEGLWKR